MAASMALLVVLGSRTRHDPSQQPRGTSPRRLPRPDAQTHRPRALRPRPRDAASLVTQIEAVAALQNMSGADERPVGARPQDQAINARATIRAARPARRTSTPPPSNVSVHNKLRPRKEGLPRCGHGCLDWLVVAIRRAKPYHLPLRQRELQLPSVRGELPRPLQPSGWRLLNGAGSQRVLQGPARAGSAAAVAERAPSLVLLGVISGSLQRREMMRCTWMRMGGGGQPRSGLRIKFVVGIGSSEVEDRADVLRVNVTEGEKMRASNQNSTRSVRGVKTGTVTTYWKLAAFFRYAAQQPEPLIARADDDVFISPAMLLAHAALLLRLPNPYVYAGVFEWYSWRTRTLHSTGFGLSAGASRTRAHKRWRNCTNADRAPAHAEWPEPRDNQTTAADACVGPLAFAKGPLVIISRPAVQWLTESTIFKRDIWTAQAIASGRARAFDGPGTGRIDDDVQLGYWMSQLPGLQIVSFRRYYAWHDRWKAGVTAMISRLLLAHKVPWGEFRRLADHTERHWERAAEVQARILCEGAPCQDCAHIAGQRACVIDVELDPKSAGPPPGTCWPNCSFTRGLVPSLPEQCWQP